MFRIFHFTYCCFTLLVTLCYLDVPVYGLQRELNINLNIVKQWADRFTLDLLSIAETATGAGFLEDHYREYHQEMMIIPNRDIIHETLEEVREQMETLLKAKEKAVENLMMAADAANREYGPYKTLEELDPEEATYYNAKKLVSDSNINSMSPETQEDIKQTIHYLPLDNKVEELNCNPVNINVSTIHVPTNIYDKSTKILNGVKWSENITSPFALNMRMDPSLTWQYFCSSDGFFRVYPGIIWPRDPDKVDMFDCRVRNWYIQAATTPKNIVMLIDTSGSMKGLRKEIARNTVDKILDTLSNDDSFNIIAFSEDVSYVDQCYNRSLMQASVDNRRRMQEKIAEIGTERMANFEKALIEAFQLFQTVEEERQTILCNKAIMLITDGAPENYEETFDFYNWPEKKIRVFTYLIGKEVSDNRQVKWMACANKGDHKHISTRADVQENVQEYIKVLSRPMVQKRYHNKVWTAAYLDYVTEQSPPRDPTEPVVMPSCTLNQHKGLGMMITVAMPVFDTRNFSEFEGDEEEEDNFIDGHLLGVVGTDVRTFELMKFIPKHKLGVNGYAFAVTNHGYIIFHPDFRPMFEKEKNSGEFVPKPNYNSVDLDEVELADDPFILKELRQGMMESTHASMAMNTTVHYDDMTRYKKMTNLYFFKKVSNVFSLGFVIPKGYGEYQIRPQFNYRPEHSAAFNDPFVFISPWIYCRNTLSGLHIPMDKSTLIKIVNNVPLENLECDKDLIRMLVYDEIQTVNYKEIWTGQTEPGNRRSLIKNWIKGEYKKCWRPSLDKADCYKKTHQRFGIDLLFIGTNVGLTRFMSAFDDPSQMTDFDFPSSSVNTIEDPYYKRAVDGWQEGYNYTFYLRKATSPFGTGGFNPNMTTVVMSSAEVLNRTGKNGAVAAVVGFQMKYTRFLEFFENITLYCPDGANCDFTCNDTDYLNCYLLDNSGFVMASNNKDGNDTSLFFGEVDTSLMKEMIDYGIYHSQVVTDYQGVCTILASNKESSASRALNPLINVFGWFMWSVAEFILFFSQWSFYSIVNVFDFVRGNTYEEAKVFYSRFLVDPETNLRPHEDHVIGEESCIKQATLYSLNVAKLQHEGPNGFVRSITGCAECNRINRNGTYIVRWIEDTNLILVVAAANCSCGEGDSSEPEISVKFEKATSEDDGECPRSKMTPPRDHVCFDSTIEKETRCQGSRARSSLLLLALLVLKSLLS